MEMSKENPLSVTTPTATDEASEDESRMSFTEHLGELRTRIIRAGIAVIIGAILCYAFSDGVLRMLAYPIAPLPWDLTTLGKESAKNDPESDTKNANTEDSVDSQTDSANAEDTAELESEVVAQTASEDSELDKPAPRVFEWMLFHPLEIVFVKIKIAGYGGLFFAFPYVLFQMCAFIFPGLKPKERRAVNFLVFGCSTLAFAGAATAYWGVLPLVMPYIILWIPEGMNMILGVSKTLSMVIKGIAAFAIAFQFPVVVLMLVYMDMLSPEMLKKYRRVAIVGLAVGAAMLTPPDPISMLIMMMPLYMLYELSILLSYLVVRRKKAKAEEAEVG